MKASVKRKLILLICFLLIPLGLWISAVGFTTTSDYKTHLFIGGMVLIPVGILLMVIISSKRK